MITPLPHTKYLIYLLHFDQPVGRARHYLGITKAERLPKRMREHQVGNAASLTRLAGSRSIGWTLAGLWPTDDPALEKKMKRAGHLNHRCSECANPGHVHNLFAAVHHFTPIAKLRSEDVLSFPS